MVLLFNCESLPYNDQEKGGGGLNTPACDKKGSLDRAEEHRTDQEHPGASVLAAKEKKWLSLATPSWSSAWSALPAAT